MEMNLTLKPNQEKPNEQYAGGGTGTRGRERNPRVRLEYGGYQTDDKVAVIRTDGTLEFDK
ncbi:MAG: hypothetical protein AAB863_00245 [Patescibacteria group bacterium]